MKILGVVVFLAGVLFVLISTAQYSNALSRFETRQKKLKAEYERDASQTRRLQREMIQKAGGGNFLIPQIPRLPVGDGGLSQLNRSVEIWAACNRLRSTVFLIVAIFFSVTLLMPGKPPNASNENEKKKSGLPKPHEE